jgi:hypothetical protein
MSTETDHRLAVLKTITEWCVSLGWDEDTAASIAREFVRRIQSDAQ